MAETRERPAAALARLEDEIGAGWHPFYDAYTCTYGARRGWLTVHGAEPSDVVRRIHLAEDCAETLLLLTDLPEPEETDHDDR